MNIYNLSQYVDNKKLWIAFFILTFAIFYPFIWTGFTNFDQIEYYSTANQSLDFIIDESIRYAKISGRFYLLITMPFHFLIYSIKNIILIKIIHLTLIVLNFVFFAFIVYKISNNKWFGYLTYLLLISFISISGENNIIVGYPIYFSFPTLLLELSVLSILTPPTLKKKHILLSSILFLIALLFYEIYIFYFPLIGIIIYLKNHQNEGFNTSTFKNYLLKIIPYFIVLSIYFISYILYRLLVSSGSYEGSQINPELTPVVFLDVITSIARGAYPLYYFFSNRGVLYNESFLFENHQQDFIYIFFNSKIEWHVLACVTIAIAYFLLNKIKNFALPRFYWIVIFIAFIYIYVPHFLLGISSKYAYAIKNWGTDNYLTNYFSTFSIALLIATIIIFLVIKMKYKFVLPMILTLLYFSSLLNLYTNYHAAEDLKDTYHLTNAIDLLKETETFKALPPNAKLYSPELYNKISISNINSEYFDWSKYFNLFNNKKIQVIKTIDTSNIDNTYYLRTGLNKKHSEVFFVWSKIKNINEQNIIGDTVTIFNYSTIKNYSVQLYKQSNDSVVYINNNKIISKGLIQNIPIFYNDTHDPLTTTKIIGKDIILNSVVLHQNILQ